MSNISNKDKIETPYIRYYFVLFLDVLGQQRQLAAWQTLPQDGEITSELLSGIKNSAEVIIQLVEDFEKFFQDFSFSNRITRVREQITLLKMESEHDRERYPHGE